VSVQGIKLTEIFGFRDGTASVHTGRTMMLTELRLLLDHVAVSASVHDYVTSIVEENVLGKPTRAARQQTMQRLRDLYGVDPACTLFRLLRQFWSAAPESRPMLAFLVASARDSLLRDMTPFIQTIPLGQLVISTAIVQELATKYPQRFSTSTLLSTARNLASTWSQAGYLHGRSNKVRTQPQISPGVTAFALLIGYLAGLRGSLLLDSIWTRLLDCTMNKVVELATEASKQGWLNFKASGSVIEISFPGVLTELGGKSVHESY
jgi:hypothetical protein